MIKDTQNIGSEVQIGCFYELQSYFHTSLQHILLCHWAKAPSQMDREDSFVMLMIYILGRGPQVKNGRINK